MKETPIQNVSDTSFWVAHYRAVESERKDALFRDPLARVLVDTRGAEIAATMGPVSRYTEWAVISRTVIIDRFIEGLIREGADAVLNLGAGLDTRPYRMSLPADFQWIEADYPHIVEYKNQKLAREKPHCRLTRYGVDLADPERRREFLRQVAPEAKKIIVLTEGVIPYLSPEQVSELSADLRADGRFAFWIAEYFHQRVYKYLKSSVRTRQMRNAPFLFFPADWLAFFKSLGWEAKELRFGSEVARESGRTPPMPWFARVMMLFLPGKMKKEAGRMAGYVVFQPTSPRS